MNSQQVFELLENKQQELIKRISAIEADFKKGRSADFTEHTTESENDEVLDEIHREAKAELKLIKVALLRLENNEYGRCAECDGEILPERLAALPYTTLCINCAQLGENYVN
ncbi:TraR/DksA family transcriptional regulator [Thalassotalea profundi]|uniref:Dimethylmenaquinone methyltransferase n=1 Tax=Thalassotalea profundi TaxID=2036687 RepID=A0ABQ3J0E9_9GAMM|nr:TraR/DksA C4-type zinc finger protein [Thalassotalea profundi]GHE97254.1 dimethylmenaquinone methyltransferase [Thalassotalea profundi]